jgi:hypothetical protein
MHDSTANQQQRNAEVVARGGGSDQARYCSSGECPICNGSHNEDDHRDKESCKHFDMDTCTLNGKPDDDTPTEDIVLCEDYQDCIDYEEK